MKALVLALGGVALLACGDADTTTPDTGGVDPVDTADRIDPAVLDALTNALFDSDRVVFVAIELSDADWELIRNEGRALTEVFSGCAWDYEYTYVSGHVTVDGESYENVAVRKKGFLGSLSTKRPSLKLNFGKFEQGRTHSGRSA